jgi:hypothetical protein
MPPVTPNGRGLGLNLTVGRDARNWPFLAKLTTPPTQTIDLRGGFPYPVKDQGALGRCTAAAGTALMEWLLQAADTPGGATPLSMEFSYWANRTEDGTSISQDAGASSQSIGAGFRQYGACPDGDMPDHQSYTEVPSTQARQDALARVLAAYYEIQGDLLGGVWAALSGGVPCLMGFQVPASFEQTGGDGLVPDPQPGEQILGGHEVVICGYRVEDGRLIIRNSWGAGWGDRGYAYVPQSYWQYGLVMDHFVLAFSSAPAPTPPTPTPQPEPDVDTQDILDTADEIIRLVGVAQADRCPYNATKAQYQASMNQVMNNDIGPIADWAQHIKDVAGSPPKPPEPGPTPGPTFALPCVQNGVLGQTKWLAGSLGCDVFVPDGSPAMACCDGVIEEVIGGVGLSGGAEMILSAPDKSVAFRYRHTQANVQVGQAVTAGQVIGRFHDDSLNTLCPQPVTGYPGGWQHCDLSVNSGTDQFAPTGGGGGNVSSYQWLIAHGYQGTVVARTPGPPSCGMAVEEAIVMMTPVGRR